MFGDSRDPWDSIAANDALTLVELFRRRALRSPDGIAYMQCAPGTGQWQNYSWREMVRLADRWQYGLARENLEPGERVAVLLRNSAEWVAFEQAALALGLVVVPLYRTDNPANQAHVLHDSGCRLLLVESAEHWQPLAPLLTENGPRTVLVLEGEAAGCTPVDGWLPGKADEPPSHRLSPETPATIIYTSGTTGPPKGVVLSHQNILTNAHGVQQRVPAYRDDVFLSFLPLSHAFERTAGHYLPMIAGSTVAYARSIQDLAEDFITIRPTVLLSVPRIYERVFEKIAEKVQEKGGLAPKLLELAVETGWQRFEHRMGRRHSLPLAARLLGPLLARIIARKILDRFGGRIRVAVSGGAPLPEPVARFFVGLGLPLLQGYGLTEASPVVSTNTLADNLPASVGRPLPGVETKVNEAGELLVRGPGVMREYWQRPEETAATVDGEGWLRTGDLVEVRDEKIFIRGRLKEIIVTSTGEKVPPADIEAALQQDPLILQAMLVGEGKPFCAALLVLDPGNWRHWTRENGWPSEDPNVLHSSIAKKALLERIAPLLAPFPVYAGVRAVHLALEPWSIENELLTVTMKLKRPAIAERFAMEIHGLYEGNAPSAPKR